MKTQFYLQDQNRKFIKNSLKYEIWKLKKRVSVKQILFQEHNENVKYTLEFLHIKSILLYLKV